MFSALKSLFGSQGISFPDTRANCTTIFHNVSTDRRFFRFFPCLSNLKRCIESKPFPTPYYKKPKQAVIPPKLFRASQN